MSTTALLGADEVAPRPLHLVRGAVLVPPRDDAPFALLVGRASPQQSGGVARRHRRQWVDVPEAHHHRDGRVATQALEHWALPPTPRVIPRHRGDAVYLGVAIDHFGHYLTESIHRLWALSDPRVPESVPGIMLVPHGRSAPLPFHLEVLDSLGVARERVLWVREPLRVSRLWVPELASRLGEPVDARYVGEQYAATRTALGALERGQPIYVHKPLDHGRGVTLGAGWLAQQLESHGVRTVVPERLPISGQLHELATASHVIADQGSALHLLDVLGRIDAPISLLARPDHASYLHDFGALRTPDWAARVCVRALPAPPGIADATWKFTSLSRFDVDTLESFLRERLGIDLVIDRAALRAAETRDLDAWQSFGPALYTDEVGVRASLPEWRERLDLAG